MTTKNTNRIITLFLISFFFLSSCGKSILNEEKTLVGNEWKRVDGSLFFELNVKDTINAYDIFLSMEYDINYTFDYLSAGITVFSPQEEMRYSEAKILLKDDKGAFSGEKRKKTWFIVSLVKEALYFNNKGKYKIEVENLTGDKFSVPGINKIGLIIKKSKNQ